MKARRYTVAQILAILREAEGRMPVAELCRAFGVSGTCYRPSRRLSVKTGRSPIFWLG